MWHCLWSCTACFASHLLHVYVIARNLQKSNVKEFINLVYPDKRKNKNKDRRDKKKDRGDG